MSENQNEENTVSLTVVEDQPTETEQTEPELQPIISTVEDSQQEVPILTITLGDLEQIVNLIDTLTQRGSFRGPELQPVGRLRDHIVNYVNQNLPKVPATQ